MYVWTNCSLIMGKSSLGELKLGVYQGNRVVEGMGILEGEEERGRTVGEEEVVVAEVE